MTDTSIIELYFRRSERAINESQASYGGYCYRVADGILRDARDVSPADTAAVTIASGVSAPSSKVVWQCRFCFIMLLSSVSNDRVGEYSHNYRLRGRHCQVYKKELT